MFGEYHRSHGTNTLGISSMLMFWKKKIVFLSVPKTGTTAIESALSSVADMVVSDPPELKHAPLYRYNRFFRPMFEKVGGQEMETVAVVREPVSWLSSWYRYRQRPFMRGKPGATFEVSFDQFVLEYLKGTPAGFANVGSQAKFLEPRPNGTKVTHLFQYENQPAFIAFMEERLNTKIILEKTNVSPTMDINLAPDIERKFRRKRPDEFALWEGIKATS